MTPLRAVKIAIHLALVFVAFLAAYEVRRAVPLSWWLTDPLAERVLIWGALYTLVAGLVEGFLRVERSSWRFASSREVLRLALGASLTAAIFIVIMFIISRADALPRSTFVLSAVFSLLFLVGVRMAWKLRWNPSLALDTFRRPPSAPPLWLVGGATKVEAALRAWDAGAERDFYPAAIFTQDRSRIGQVIHGVPVAGDAQALAGESLALNGPPPAILFLADPVSEVGLTSAEIGRLRARGHRLLRQPNAVELGTASGGLREMKLEEFLPRPPLTLDTAPVARLVTGRRVMVTGAGGSIGSEIARQLVRFGCSHITLLDHSEFALFEIDRELQRLAPEGITRRAVLCNVRDERRLAEIFAVERPQIVFHAAALKHVTLVETNPREGVLTNVGGTWNVAVAARDAGAEDMVLISTDKAVDPSNVMGSTKRIAEALLEAHVGGRTRYSVVRFGNVLGSAGSVVPIFRDQIERGGPVTVTHPDVTRFFMTIPEASQLVLHATALRRDDPPNARLRKFVLEMGEPVRIIDLARQMVELSGEGGAKVQIEITGLRPGEKLTEELLDSDEVAVPCVAGVTEIAAADLKTTIGQREVRKLSQLAVDGNDEAIRLEVRELLKIIRQRAGGAPALHLVSARQASAG